MIIVNVKREDGRINTVTMSGHADAGPYGYDLVCAGASAVSFGAVNAIEILCHVQPVIKQNHGGYLHISVPTAVVGSQDEKVQLLLEGMLVSLKTIAANYDEHITINDQQGGEQHA